MRSDFAKTSKTKFDKYYSDLLNINSLDEHKAHKDMGVYNVLHRVLNDMELSREQTNRLISFGNIILNDQ